MSAATLYGFYDALNSTRRDWQMLHGGPDTPSPFRPLAVSADGQPFEGGNGVRITPDASFADCPRPDVAVVTDLMIPPGTPLNGLYEREVAWMRDVFEAGGTLASACSTATMPLRTGPIATCWRRSTRAPAGTPSAALWWPAPASASSWPAAAWPGTCWCWH